jgi:hypothetical protein
VDQVPDAPAEADPTALPVDVIPGAPVAPAVPAPADLPPADLAPADLAPADLAPADLAPADPAPAEGTAPEPLPVPFPRTDDDTAAVTVPRLVATDSLPSDPVAAAVPATSPSPSGSPAGPPAAPVPLGLPVPLQAPVGPAAPTGAGSGTSASGSGHVNHVELPSAVLGEALSAAQARAAGLASSGSAGDLLRGADAPGIRPD